MTVPHNHEPFSKRYILAGALSAPVIILAWLVNAAFADDSMPLQIRYCAGMMQEQRVPLGGRVDCISDEYAIEIEWAEDWYHAVGQSLYYAVAMERKPGIILLCPDSSVHGEGLCRSYIYRLEAALSLVKVPVAIWECFPEDATLADCFRPEIGGPSPAP